MTQSNPIIGANKSGIQYRTEDNDGKKALLNHHKGSAAPSYAEAGVIWIDDAATPWLLKVYDGADWITIGAVNASGNIFTPYYGAAGPRLLNHATDTGSANAYAVAPSPAITAYATGQMVTLKPANANTGASTININSLGTKSIKLLGGSDPGANAMVTTGVYILVYDGTNFILANPSGSSVTFDSLSPMTTLGDIIYGTTSGAGARLGGNSAASKKVLVSEGTGSVAQAPAWALTVGTAASNLVQLDGSAKLPAVDGSQLTNIPAAWRLLDTKTASSSATLDFTSIITSAYACYVFVFENIISASNNVNFLMRVSENNGSSFLSSSYAYQNAAITIGGTTAPTYTGSMTGSGHIVSAAQSGTQNQVGGEVRLFNPLMTVAPYAFATGRVYSDANMAIITQSDGKLTAAAGTGINAVRFLMSSGNMTSGKIYCYGAKNS